jgi:hypothetical protein
MEPQAAGELRAFLLEWDCISESAPSAGGAIRHAQVTVHFPIGRAVLEASKLL